MRLTKIILPCLILTIIILTGCSQQKDQRSAEKNITGKKPEGSIIREGVINVDSIDLNKDGKVFQCAMDLNVISDSAGICPLCKMDLEEVTISDAKENLIKSDYKVR